MLRKILAVDDSALIHQMSSCSSPYKLQARQRDDGLEAGQLGRGGHRPHPARHQHPVMNGLEFLSRLQKERLPFHPGHIISTEGKEEDTIRG